MTLLMPKATAAWLIDNTTLTFDQIAEFCQLHILQVQTLADDDTHLRMTGMDPIASGQLTQEEIKRCEEKPHEKLLMKQNLTADDLLGKKKSKYTPIAKRHDKPNAIAWLLKYYPNITDQNIINLIGTTKKTILAIKNKTHKNSANIKPQNPVQLGICSINELNKMIQNHENS